MNKCSHQVWKLAQEIADVNRTREEVKDPTSEKLSMSTHATDADGIAKLPQGV